MNNSYSRREIYPFHKIQLMISHPDFVYVPLPSVPSPFSTSTSSPKIGSRKRKMGEEKEKTLLQSSILPSLQHRGLIAETLSSTQKSWEGIIRIPEQRGEWGDRAERVAGVENLEGQFRRMMIKWVVYMHKLYSLLSFFSPSVSYLTSVGELPFSL